ncbi:MAG TPA: hypothetical protein VGF14_06205 [Alphaproteobacteria bacterium]
MKKALFQAALASLLFSCDQLPPHYKVTTDPKTGESLAVLSVPDETHNVTDSVPLRERGDQSAIPSVELGVHYVIFMPILKDDAYRMARLNKAMFADTNKADNTVSLYLAAQTINNNNQPVTRQKLIGTYPLQTTP